MNVQMKSTMRCTKYQNSKKLLSSVKEDAENVTKPANAWINNKNENSPKSCREYIAPNNHSTPVRQKPSLDKVEEPSDLDYSPNPILLPCTQDGGNEVAWDWQNTLSKTPNSRSNKQNVQSETPKGTKLFPRKRNSDSPLLCKPLKRKTINMENMEHIGQFAAELQALSEKMKIIKQNDQSESDDCIKEAPVVVNTSNEKEVQPTVRDKENCGTETNSHNNVSKKSSSYDDLFDDSVDDSMARCTQEIEEKLNLIAGTGSSTVHPQTDIKEEKLSPASDTIVKISPTQFKESTAAVQPKVSPKSLFHGGTTGGSILRTYSKLPLKKDASSSMIVSPWKDKDLHKLCLNNNMLHYDVEESLDDKKSSRDSAVELFGIPDDSFDDCLATCIEDDKLFSTPAESGGFSAPKIEPSYKTLTHAPLIGKQYSNSSNSSNSTQANSTAKVETSTVGSLSNRKFFKSKSLSDKCIGQNVIANCKNTAHVTFPSYSAKSASHLNPSPKMSYGRSIGHSSVRGKRRW
ncbi:PREDICTED: uncharacterized protein LOC106746329 isoform X2 [Dinoponera quadriceps]|uniref:Uncharacterized protein LOC106746329 isoform X2 n=1 Tax=Dinoponera quadriceps TaxID=609295 RepID=A0A6P3XK10_DINQU|nr:PREDICTED: uncharacterized protein LOC106746329 isoform X2 [Dinoponera quadriceps]